MLAKQSQIQSYSETKHHFPLLILLNSPVIEPRGIALPRWCPIVNPTSGELFFKAGASSFSINPFFKSNWEIGTKLKGSSSNIVFKRSSQAFMCAFRVSSSARVTPKQICGGNMSKPQKRSAPYCKKENKHKYDKENTGFLFYLFSVLRKNRLSLR